MGFGSSSGRCARSRHLAEAHPQVLIIALLRWLNTPMAERVSDLALTVKFVDVTVGITVLSALVASNSQDLWIGVSRDQLLTS